MKTIRPQSLGRKKEKDNTVSSSIYNQFRENFLKQLKTQDLKDQERQLKLHTIISQTLNQQNDEQGEASQLEQLFKDSTWRCEFHQQFLTQLNKYQSQQQSILILSLIIAEGYFDQKHEEFQTQLVQQKAQRPLSNLFLFKYNLIDLSILFEVGLHKQHLTENQQLIGFEIEHKITFIDIRNDIQLKYLITSAQQYTKQIQRNPYRSDLPLITSEKVIVPKIKQTQFTDSLLYKFEETNWGSLVFGEIGKTKRWVPYEFPKFKINQLQKFTFVDDKYVSKDWLNIRKQNQQYQKCLSINKSLFQRYTDFKAASKIIDYLHTYSSFKTKLSIQERQLLEESGNIMVIGRSGTGKTTCAILRLFAMQLLLKYRIKITAQRQTIFMHSQNENQTIGLHCLFTAQNQMLVDEVKQQYKKLIFDLKPQENNQLVTETDSESDWETLNPQDIQQLMLEDVQQQNENIQGNLSDDQQLSLLKYRDRDFPLFLSIKELIIQLDDCMNYPYLQNERFVQEEDRLQHAGWQVGEAHQIKINLGNNQFKIIRLIEVDYNYFRTIFWPTLQNSIKKQFNSEQYKNLVWTQIYSYIKGSEYSHQYLDQGLPFQIFYNNFNQSLTLQQAQEIYDIYLNYEKWKQKQGLFDRMDIVNYQINCVERFQFKQNPIHFTMIDEIQDLPHATIKLISKITEQSLYCSGDTAQNIQKGVGFRFQDLRTLLCSEDNFSDLTNDKVKLHQLTINFRSHNSILQLANNVVSLIETLFPKTIDKLKKEISENSGPKPKIVQSNYFQTLIRILRPENQNQQQIEQINLMGAEKVIIVRDNDAKKKINQIIDNILCLTVQEAKGLEFNDVVLFNFFMEQDVLSEQWQLLQHLKYENDKLILDPRFNYQMNNYGPLCMELKQLYVCITRAKQRIIIFDEDCSKRLFIEQMWFQQGLVEFFKEENIFNNQQDNKDVNRNRNLEFQRNAWKEKGIKLFEVKNYNEAMKCFRFSGDLQLEKKSKAFYMASTAQQEINQITAKWKSKQHFSRLEQEKINEDYKIITSKCYIDFEEAAQIFVEIEYYKEAGQCYFSCQQYQNALNNYLWAQDFLGAADSAFESQLYQLAGIIYLKNNYFDKCIKSFEKIYDYQMIIEVLSISQYYYKDYQQQMNKYTPLLIDQMLDKLNRKQSELNYDQIKEYLEDLQEEFTDQFQILSNFYIPTDIEQLLVFIWNNIRLNKDFIINQLDEQFAEFDKQNSLQLFQTKLNRFDKLQKSHYDLLQDILEYYNINSLLTLLQQDSNYEQIPKKQFYKNYILIYRNSFLFIKDHNQILKQQFQFEQEEIKFLAGLKKDFKKQQFAILYLFGFNDFQSKFLNQIEQKQKLLYKPFIETFVINKIQQTKKIDHVELLQKIELILDINCKLGWNEGVDIFHSIVLFFVQDRQNLTEGASKIYTFSEAQFRTIILFLSFASNILKYNHSIHIQLQLFAAICQINHLTMPTYEYLRIISQSYLIYKGDEQVAKKKWKIVEFIQIGESLYLVNTNKVVNAIRKQFQEISREISQIYYKNSVDANQASLMLYQQIFLSKNKDFVGKSKKLLQFTKLSKLQKDYKLYLEKGLRQKFFQNTQFLYFIGKQYLDYSFLNLISYQLIIKSILQTIVVRRMEKILIGMQLISYCPNQKESDIYYEKFKSTSKMLNEFSQNDVEDIQHYMKAQQVLRFNYVDFDYIHYLLLSYRNPNIQSTIQRDFMTSFMYVLIMIQMIQQQNDDKFHLLLFGKIQIDQKIKLRAYQQFIGQFLIQDKDTHTFQVSNQFNKQILIQMFTKWIGWYMNNFKKIGEIYIYILNENCNKELKDIIIKQVEESTIGEQQKLNILDQGSKKDNAQLEQILIKLIIIKQDSYKNYQQQNPQNQITFHNQIIFQSIRKFEIQSSSILLTATEYFREQTQFQKGIYINKFSKCFKLVENIRQKLIFFIYKFCNSSLKFRTAMIELTELQFYQQELMDAIFFSNFDYKHIYSKLKRINLKINNWQQKNWKYKEELRKYDEKQQQDPNFIKLLRYLKLSKQLNYQNNSSMNAFYLMGRNDLYN